MIQTPSPSSSATAGLWLGLTLSVVITLSVVLPLEPNDYWWYMRLGRDTLVSGAIPTLESLSYTQAGKPIVNHAWLVAMIFWQTDQFAGLEGTFLWRVVLLSGTYGLLWYLACRAGARPGWATGLVMGAVLVSSNNWALRTQHNTNPQIVNTLWQLWEWHTGQARRLWLLPLMSLLWVNVHGSFIIFFVLTGAALVFGSGARRWLAGWLGLACVATLINPRGLGAWGYVWDLVSNTAVQAYSREWQKPSADTWQTQLYFGWHLIWPLGLVLTSRRLTRLEWVWFLGFGWLGLSGLRHIVWDVYMLTLLSARLVGGWTHPWLARLPRFPARYTHPLFHAALGVVLAISPLGLLPGIRERWWSGPAIPVYRNTPVAATQWLAQHPSLPGPLWAELAFSSYLVFALPERPVWIDTRFEVYPPEQWERYLAINRADADWQRLLDEAGVNMLMLSVTQQPRLVEVVSRSTVWCDVYADDLAQIFARRTVEGLCPSP